MKEVIKKTYEMFLEALLKGDQEQAEKVIADALAEREKAKVLYVEVVIAAHRELQKRFFNEQFSEEEFRSRRQITWNELTRLKAQMKGIASTDQSAFVVCLDQCDSDTEGLFIGDMLTLRGWQARVFFEHISENEFREISSRKENAVFIIPVLCTEGIENVKEVVNKINAQVPRILTVLVDIGNVSEGSLSGLVDSVVPTSEVAVTVVEELINDRNFSKSLDYYLKRIGSRIRSQRENLQLSQSSLSQRCGLDRAYLSAIENGKQNVTISALLKLCKSLEMTLEELIGGEGLEGNRHSGTPR